MKRITTLATVLVTVALFLSACSSTPSAALGQAAQPQFLTQSSQTATAVPAAPVTGGAPSASGSGALNAFEGVFEQIYQQVNPSVVNIQVSMTAADTSNSPFGNNSPFGGNNPFGFNNPGQGQNQGPQVQQALGSGFVWDKQGHIVTNNHVVDGATDITVTFSDGSTYPGKVIGHDPNSDLAVVQVQAPADKLQPVTLADAASVKVGQVAIAIGNPYGLSGTMTMGIVSAIGRSISSDNTVSGSSYSIPDIIQTDAPINPGNSGGVLLDENGHVVGVTAAIESQSGANAGIGFAIPTNIVSKVVPSLIQNGDFQYSWLGISGTTLTYDLNQALNLNTDQRGALVIEVTAGGPADKAGIKGSDKQQTVNGQDIPTGGDVITAIDGNQIKTFDELVSYLVNNTQPGQKVTLSILRGGKQQNVDVTLQARPGANAPQAQAGGSQSQQPNNRQGTQQAPTSGVFLGISGIGLTPDLNQAMNLNQNQKGVLVEAIQSNSPAEQAGLQASTQPATIGGQQIMIGGDIITAVNGKAVTSVAGLRQALNKHKSGDVLTLSILRNGQEVSVKVTLATSPAQ